MSNNCCSEVYSSSPSRSSRHVPGTSPSGLCSTEMKCRDAPCSPTSSLGSNTPHDKCQETCSDHGSCQPNSCNRSTGSPSVCSPVTSGVSESEEGSRCLPVTFNNSKFDCPASCRQPLSCYFPSYQSYGCRPLDYLTYGGQPLSYHPPLRNLTYGCQSFSCMPYYYRPKSYIYGSFQPYASSLSDWRYSY